MKKLMVFCFPLCFLACDNSEIDNTMTYGDIAGTYWEQQVVYRELYENGKLTDSFKNTFDGQTVGTGGPSVWYFKSEGTLVEYLSHGDREITIPENSYKLRSCEYLPDERTFIIHEKSGDEMYVVKKFTPLELTLVCEEGDEVSCEKRTIVFTRFYPSDEWKQGVARFPDYDDIDW